MQLNIRTEFTLETYNFFSVYFPLVTLLAILCWTPYKTL